AARARRRPTPPTRTTPKPSSARDAVSLGSSLARTAAPCAAPAAGVRASTTPSDLVTTNRRSARENGEARLILTLAWRRKRRKPKQRYKPEKKLQIAWPA